MDKKRFKNIGLDLLTDIIGGLFVAIGTYNFAAMAGFPVTGVYGVAIVFFHYFKWPIGIVSLIINIPIAAACAKTLGMKFMFRSLVTIGISTVMMDVVAPLFPVYEGEILLSCICRAIFSGIGYGLIYMRNTSTGGTDFIMMTVRAKKPHLTLGKISRIIDITVLLINGFFMGADIDKIIYGLIGTYIATIVIDKVIYGSDNGKVTLVITDQGKSVAAKIFEMTQRGATFLYGTGSYSNEEKQIVMCACSDKQMHLVQNAIKEIDNKAFMVTMEASEIRGEGFKGI